MGSATTQALAATTAALNDANGVDLDVARELFAAAGALGETPQLSGALSAAVASAEARTKVVTDVFGGFAPVTQSLLSTIAVQRWSSTDDLISAVEEVAIRAAAVAAPTTDIDAELFEVSRAVAGSAELELALGSRLGDAKAKGVLIESILAGRASEPTTLIVSSLVQHSRGRRVRTLLGRALRIVADQRGRTVATVHAARALSDAQISRLRASLGQRYGTDVALSIVVDPTVVGGVRVEIGDDVIDATVSSRLGDLRQRLAG
ncbi:F0F1 ATP synthase subunit delta [Microbacterium invictum]|uniref:ATP synthase subunit delta n=1 Tax=Microbacterium invictum TaxID=515415 RepID=A0AA40SNT9_9MICO|nr:MULTISPECIES: F0F1 ATP synthase subunit delta [Microbacterium]MBB4139642.1 F-type H+-transporting ATPase subunit delta [Microbacterium invictum]